MKYGFFVDLNLCIGCKACEVSCANEFKNSQRLNVKYIDFKTFPDTKREFIPYRCNHCDDAPCLKICPTLAIEKRDNGVVDIDKSRCIGCRACQMACPYSAISIIDGKADKCSACNHLTENGLMPSCVTACPSEAIIFGDLLESNSLINKKLQEKSDIKVLKPNLNTKPKHFYSGNLVDSKEFKKYTIFNKKRY